MRFASQTAQGARNVQTAQVILFAPFGRSRALAFGERGAVCAFIAAVCRAQRARCDLLRKPRKGRVMCKLRRWSGALAFGERVSVCTFCYSRLSHSPQASATSGLLRKPYQGRVMCKLRRRSGALAFGERGAVCPFTKAVCRAREAGTHPRRSFAYTQGPCGLLCKPQRARLWRALAYGER